MIVSDLIEKLKTMPQDLEVVYGHDGEESDVVEVDEINEDRECYVSMGFSEDGQREGQTKHRAHFVRLG